MTLLQLRASATLALDAETDVSDSGDEDGVDEAVDKKAAAGSVVAAAAARKLVAAKRSRKARKPGVADVRGRHIRGCLTSLGTLMNIGNGALCAVENLYAALVIKPGGLLKHCVHRWHAMGIGPPYTKTSKVFLEVGDEHLDPIITYNNAREHFPVSHANQRPTWSKAGRRRSVSPGEAEARAGTSLSAALYARATVLIRNCVGVLTHSFQGGRAQTQVRQSPRSS